ncbi:MAG: pentapeptide repeat-containing protein [Candidatus Lokiarchaeia archaeon]
MESYSDSSKPELQRPTNEVVIQYMKTSYFKDWSELTSKEKVTFRSIIATVTKERWQLVPEIKEKIFQKIKEGAELKGFIGRRILLGFEYPFFDLAGIDLKGECLSECKLAFTNLTNCNLFKVRIIRGNLFKAILRESNLDLIDIKDTNLIEADLKKCTMFGARLEGVSLNSSQLDSTMLFRSVFQNCDLRGASLLGAFLSGLKLRNCEVDDTTKVSYDLTPTTTLGLYEGSKVEIARELKNAFRNSGFPGIAKKFYYVEMYYQKALIREQINNHLGWGWAVVIPKEFKAKSYKEDFEIIEKMKNMEQIADSLGRLQRLRELSVTKSKLRHVLKDLYKLTKLYFLDFLFGFGQKPFRVLRTIIIVILGFAMLYLCSGLEYKNQTIRISDYLFDPTWKGFKTLLTLSLNSLYFSATTFTTLIYGDVNPLGWSRLYATIEAVLGVVLSALFVVTLARKYILD